MVAGDERRSAASRLDALVARSACPACLNAPLTPDGDALGCTACLERWPIVSTRPLVVRLAHGREAIGAVFVAPPLSPSPIRRAIRRWQDRYDESFAPTVSAVPDSQLDAISSVCARVGGSRPSVLDIGGGSGRWRRAVSTDADYVALDVIDPSALELDDSLTYVIGVAERLPFADATFDVAMMMEVLEHLPEPALALAEVRRVLRVGGLLVLSTRQAWATHGAPNDYFRYTRYGLEHLLRGALLEPFELKPLGGPAAVIVVTLENAIGPLRKPVMRQIVTHQLWRLAALLDRTVFRDGLAGSSPDPSGWLVFARAA